MPARRVTIRDVARAAGVSTTTVSDALAGRGRMAEETRQRVRRVARSTGYVASAAARNLRLGRSGSVGLYVPDRAVGFEYYVHLSRGAAEAALDHGFALTLVPAWDNPDQLRALHLDGLIVSDPALDDPTLQILRSLPVPMVTCERDPAPDAVPVGVVQSDHVTAMGQLLAHVRAAGARTIAVLAPGAETSFGQDIRKACRISDLDLALVDIPLAYAVDDITNAMRNVLADPPQAVIAVPDGAALTVLQHLHETGTRVPHDILLAAYVDGPSLQTCKPPITGVDIHPRITGASAVEALVQFIEGRTSTPICANVSAELMARASTLG